ncbi:MAG TPA: hypothetical protein PLJ38_02600 [bacterium]|nr:hypothetical protein [bacterium]
MEWKFDNLKNEWNLIDNNDAIYKIKTIVKSKNPKNKFVIKSYYSIFLAGKHKAKLTEKKNQLWIKDTIRKFQNQKEHDDYLTEKKKQVYQKIHSFFYKKTDKDN